MIERTSPQPDPEQDVPPVPDPARVQTPDPTHDPGAAVEEEGEPFDGNFA